MPEYHPKSYTEHGFTNHGDFPGSKALPEIINEAQAFGLNLYLITPKIGGKDRLYYNTEFVLPDTRWHFTRSWIYWSARTYSEGLSQEAADRLWQSHGGVVRADGHYSSPRPEGEVTHYHIDTPAGLQALIAAIKEG